MKGTGNGRSRDERDGNGRRRGGKGQKWQEQGWKGTENEKEAGAESGGKGEVIWKK